MAINADDVKLKGSERLTDNDDGGGRMTGYEIVSGDINNLFPDISRLDRTYGRVNLRKAFLHVDTPNVDLYYGAHQILTDPPDDPNVSALLFSTDSHTDERLQAQDRIESYVTRGPAGHWFLYDRQLEGQRSINLFARPDAPAPEVGDVLFLVQFEGQQDEYFQYVRIISVSADNLTFNGGDSGCGTFTRQVITCDISVPLRHTFDGPAITCLDTLTPDAVVRTTQVADASKYYGVVRLQADVNQGDLVLQAATVYGQLVPSTQGDSPVRDVQAGGLGTQAITSGAESFDIVGPVHTADIPIEINNRGYNYTFNCQPIPGPGTLAVEYRAMGRWYRLQDNGAGELEGEGTGTVNFATGSVIVTLGALPDVGTSLLFYWSAPVHFIDRAGSAEVDPVTVDHTLAGPVKPGTLAVGFVSGGVAKTITDDSKGRLTGDGSGFVVYVQGRVRIELTTAVPDPNSQLTIDYEEPALQTHIESGVSLTAGMGSVVLPNTPVAPGSATFTWQATQEQRSTQTHYEWEIERNC